MEEEPISAPASSNRTFIILLGLMIAFLFLGVLCIGGYALFIGPRINSGRQTQVAQVNAQNTEIALQNLLASVTPDTPTPDETLAALDLTLTAAAQETPTPVVASTDTDTPEPETPTLEPSQTLVIESLTPSPTGPTPTASKTPSPTRLGGHTATPLVGGLGTVTPQSAALETGTPRPGSTQLPTTGFADEAGVPGLILLGFVLIAVVIVARRLRLSLR
jgi:hypothetical protein